MQSTSALRSHGLVDGVITIREPGRVTEPNYNGWGDVYGSWTMDTNLSEIRRAMMEQHGADVAKKGPVFYNVKTKNLVPIEVEKKVKVGDVCSSSPNMVAQVYIKFTVPPPPPYVAQEENKQQ